MGPPKKKKPKIAYSEIMRQCNSFEYRENEQTQAQYIFNAFTGETIIPTDTNFMDRRFSMWAPIDKYHVEGEDHFEIYPSYYASRSWGRREFSGWQSDNQAATHMTAVARGFLARLALGRYFNMRYSTILCPYSGYYYFYDKYSTTEDEPSWYKPLLAQRRDIGMFVPDDPEDWLKGDKFSNHGFDKGPYVKKAGIGKTNVVRSEQIAFLSPNEWREVAVSQPDQIDVNETPMGSVVPWLEGMKATSLYLDEYATMRSAICNNNWRDVISQMELYPDNIPLQLHGLHCFSKGVVPLDGGLIDQDAKDAFDICMHILIDREKSYSYPHKTGALYALHNILSTRPGRAEFFNVRDVTVQGPFRQEMVEKHMIGQLKILFRYLEKIPTEVVKTSNKGSQDFIDILVPTADGVMIVGGVLNNLASLAEEQETRELMGESCVHQILFALKICHEEEAIVSLGLKIMYNFCYRCEGGQATMLETDILKLIKNVHYNFAGDGEVMRQCRRLELSLKKFGWRGNVEELIEQEIREQDIDSMYLKSIKMPGTSDSTTLASNSYLEDGENKEDGSGPNILRIDDGGNDGETNLFTNSAASELTGNDNEEEGYAMVAYDD